MSKEISFIHAADLHLDSPFKGLAHTPESIFQQIQDSTFLALDRLIQTAIYKEVDFVLLVGDLFENEDQSLKAQIHLRKAFEQLNEYQINVYLSYGNHDHMNGNIYPVKYPDNVFVFTEEKIKTFDYEREGESLATIYGFSYENRAVLENKSKSYKITNKQAPFHIAMLHGSLQTDTEHDVYAPFKVSDLVEKDFDYWALGHIHRRCIIKKDPLIVYPGNIQGRHRKETGEKGCYHVILSDTGNELSFIPLGSLEFQSMDVNVSHCEEVHQLEVEISKEINKLETSVPQLIHLTLVSNNEKFIQWKNQGYVEEIIQLVNEALINQHQWNYLYTYSIQMKKTFYKNLHKSDHFMGELIRHFDEKPILPYVNELYNHRQARKYIEKPLSEDDEKMIKFEAQELLMDELINKDGE